MTEAPLAGRLDPSVTVVVPVYGDLEGLPHLVEALRSQDYPADLLNVVLVDNHGTPTISVDGTSVTVVHQPKPGSYAARNKGVLVSTGEVLAFTDADCRPRPDWVRNGVSILLARPDRVVGGRIVVTASAQPSIAEELELRYSLRQERYVDEGYAATANVFIRRSDLDRLGGFDETLLSGADRDLARRAATIGLGYAYAPDAVVEHQARRTMRAVLAKTRRVTAGSVTVARRHGGRVGLATHVLRAMRPPVRRCIALVSDKTLPLSRRVELVGASVLDYLVGLWSTLRRVLPGAPPPPRS